MRIVLQRVKSASVIANHQTVGSIGKGAVALVGIHSQDQLETLEWMTQKLIQLRYFEDVQGKMNLSLQEASGELLIISQFTLYGKCDEGRRPAFTEAAPASIAKPLYEQFVHILTQKLGPIQTGVFGAYMELSLVNDGPVTLILEK